MKKVKSPQLYLLAKDEILGYIHENSLKIGTLLPSESHFVSQLGISRGTRDDHRQGSNAGFEEYQHRKN